MAPDVRTADPELAEEGRLADQTYARVVLPALRPEDEGKYVAFSIDTGEFEVDADDYEAVERLHARVPGVRAWLYLAGEYYTCRVRRRHEART